MSQALEAAARICVAAHGGKATPCHPFHSLFGAGS